MNDSKQAADKVVLILQKHGRAIETIIANQHTFDANLHQLADAVAALSRTVLAMTVPSESPDRKAERN